MTVGMGSGLEIPVGGYIAPGGGTAPGNVWAGGRIVIGGEGPSGPGIGAAVGAG